MTVMNIALMPDGIYVTADTMVTNQQFEPSFFTSKIHPVPHLGGLICGTGSLGFILDWSRQILGGMLAKDIAHLDAFTPVSLRALHASLPQEERDATSSTIYHLGFDRAEDRFIGFAYRSGSDFESERLEYGTRVKPGHVSDLPLTGFPDDFVEVCRAQRVEQDSIPPSERVFIGGEIVAYMMQAHRVEGRPVSVVTTISPVFEFEDFEEAYFRCTAGLAANAHLR